MTLTEHDKIINLMKHGSLHGIDTGRLDSKCEDVIPIEDAIAIVDLIYKAKSNSDKWIPLSEQLPEDGTWNFFTDSKKISVERYKMDALDHFFPEGRWFSFEDAIWWMPLPKLPKEE